MPRKGGRAKLTNDSALLSKVRNHWLRGVLEKSLEQRPLIAPVFRERLDSVHVGQQIDGQAATSLLPDGTRVVDVFDRMGALRTLLMLGAPGSGKTIELLTLARVLCDRAEQGPSQPIPVVFNLSSWRPGPGTKTFADWLVRQLLMQYQVPREQGAVWIGEEQLLLLLDGLDEMAAPLRGPCVEAINIFLRDHGKTEMVVCCRSEAYRNLPTQLNVQWAIEIEPLTDEQVSRYLDQCGERLVPLKTMVENDPAFRELARMPLMLNIMSLAYEGTVAVDSGCSASLADGRRRVFDNYIDRMRRRRGPSARYPFDLVVRSLVWLAQALSARSQSLFLLDHLQPDDLPAGWQRWLYRIVAATIAVLVTYCAVVLPLILLDVLTSLLDLGSLTFRTDLIIGLLASAPCALLVALIVGLATTIKPVEALVFSWVRLRSEFVQGLFRGALRGLRICAVLLIVWALILYGRYLAGPDVPHGMLGMPRTIRVLPCISAGILIAVTSWRPQLIVASMIALAAMFNGVIGFLWTLSPTFHARGLGAIEMDAIFGLNGVLTGGLAMGVFALLAKPCRVPHAVGRFRSLVVAPRSNLIAPAIRGVLIVVAAALVGMAVAVPVKLLASSSSVPTVVQELELLVTFLHVVIVPLPVIVWSVIPWSFGCAILGGIMGGIWRVWTQGFIGPDLEVRAFPNQGIQRTAKYAGILALIDGSVFAVLMAALYGSILALPAGRDFFLRTKQVLEALPDFVSVGGALGFLITVCSPSTLVVAVVGVSAGRAVIQHYALRAVLWLSHRLPLHFVRFLDDATDLAFLRKVGGGYLFIHRSLQEHFAAMTLPRKFKLF